MGVGRAAAPEAVMGEIRKYNNSCVRLEDAVSQAREDIEAELSPCHISAALDLIPRQLPFVEHRRLFSRDAYCAAGAYRVPVLRHQPTRCRNY